MDDIMERIGEILLAMADYIHSLTSGIVNGEEEPPKSMT